MRLSKKELEATIEALSARLAGEWGAEFGPDDDPGYTREDAERAQKKLIQHRRDRNKKVGKL